MAAGVVATTPTIVPPAVASAGIPPPGLAIPTLGTPGLIAPQVLPQAVMAANAPGVITGYTLLHYLFLFEVVQLLVM